MKSSIIRILFLFSLLPITPAVGSQISVDSVLHQVEKNNSTLAALRKKADAERLSNKTGIYLPGPQAEFNYLWGSPSAIGNRTDVSVKQSFDFPSAYAYRSKISELKNEQVELEYLKQKISVLFQVRLICTDLVYLNSMNSIISEHYENIREIFEIYKSKYNTGEIGIIDLNKAQLNLLSIQKELENNSIEITYSLNELAGYNGGHMIQFTDTIFSGKQVDPDFEIWFAKAEQNNPLLKWIRKEISVGETRIKLNKSMGLPGFDAGYMSEKITGQQYQGLTMGVFFPLWENKNMIKYAKADLLASKNLETDYRLQFYNRMKALHQKIITLQTSIDSFRLNLKSADNRGLLMKALAKGEISLTEYLIEYGIYYDSFRKLNEMEREKNRSLAELSQYN